jgi:hypothetical protein
VASWWKLPQTITGKTKLLPVWQSYTFTITCQTEAIFVSTIQRWSKNIKLTAPRFSSQDLPSWQICSCRYKINRNWSPPSPLSSSALSFLLGIEWTYYTLMLRNPF